MMLPQSYATSEINAKIEYIHRDFSISRNGIINIFDSYTIRNDGLDPITSIKIGLDEDYTSKIAYFDCIDSNNDTLDRIRIPSTGNGFDQWIILLKNPLTYAEHKNFTIEMEFVDLVSIATEKRINIQFSEFPSSPYSIEKYDLTINSFSDSTIHDPYTDSDATPPVEAPTAENIDPWTSDKLNFYITFTTGTPMQGYVSVEKNIDLNQIGYIQVEETHQVRNIGPGSMDPLSNIKFKLPVDAKNIRIYDNYSQLTFNEKSGGLYTNITISLSPNRYALRIGDTYKYHVEYLLPIENYITFSGDLVSIQIDLLLGSFDCQVYHYISNLILPQGALISSFDAEQVTINSVDGKPIITYDDYSITSKNSLNTVVVYNQVGSYWSIVAHPLLLSLFVAVIASAYVVFKRAIPFTEVKIERKSVVPAATIREFSVLYEQKIAILTEIDKLDEDYLNRKLRSREYRKLLKTAEKNISDLDKSLDEMKPEFRNAGGRYKEIVDKLEILEGEKTTTKDSLVRLKARYKRKQIKPIAYRKLNRDFRKRLEKIKSNMEKLVQELREYSI
jgi:hypothetical protein